MSSWNILRLVEVAFVLPGSEYGTLRRDIETEEATAYDGDGGDYVDVAYLLHDDYSNFAKI